MALSRRTALTAGALAAIGSVAGLSVFTQRENSGPPGQTASDTSPNTATPDSISVTSGTFVSAARGGVTTKWVIVAPRTAPRPLRPIVALHMYDGSAESAVGLGAATALERAIASGSPPVAIASVDGGARTFWHRRRSGEDPAAMVTDEFLPFLATQNLDVSRVGFLGWSMGGYGALLLGAQLGAARTAAICAVSPGLWPDGNYPEGAFDDQQDYRAHDVWGLRALDDIPIRVDCGTEDDFYPASKQFADQLAREPAGAFTPGGHDNDYWTSQLPSEIRWLAGYLG